MKKILSAVVILLCSFAIFVPQVSAKDVWAVTENNNGKITDHYIMTETVQVLHDKVHDRPIWSAGVHSVGKNFKANVYRRFYYTFDGNEGYVAIGDFSEINQKSGVANFVAIRSLNPNFMQVVAAIAVKLRDYI